MGTERAGCAGSVVLLFVPVRDGGDGVEYPLDEYAVEYFCRGCSPKGLMHVYLTDFEQYIHLLQLLYY